MTCAEGGISMQTAFPSDWRGAFNRLVLVRRNALVAGGSVLVKAGAADVAVDSNTFADCTCQAKNGTRVHVDAGNVSVAANGTAAVYVR